MTTTPPEAAPQPSDTESDPHFVLRIMNDETVLHELDLDNTQFVLYPDKSLIALNLSGNDLAAIRSLAPVVERTIVGPVTSQSDMKRSSALDVTTRFCRRWRNSAWGDDSKYAEFCREVAGLFATARHAGAEEMREIYAPVIEAAEKLIAEATTDLMDGTASAEERALLNAVAGLPSGHQHKQGG
jgi:hypothetical protein